MNQWITEWEAVVCWIMDWREGGNLRMWFLLWTPDFSWCLGALRIRCWASSLVRQVLAFSSDFIISPVCWAHSSEVSPLWLDNYALWSLWKTGLQAFGTFNVLCSDCLYKPQKFFSASLLVFVTSIRFDCILTKYHAMVYTSETVFDLLVAKIGLAKILSWKIFAVGFWMVMRFIYK